MALQILTIAFANIFMDSFIVLKSECSLVTNFHQNLKRLRKARRYSQVEMSKQFGVAQGSYSGWENRSEPDYNTLLSISEFFGVSLDELLSEDMTDQKRTVSPIRRSMEFQELNQTVENLVKVVEALAVRVGVGIEDIKDQYDRPVSNLR